jgi:multidrug transporter EmrE-like cation transporter
MNGSLRQLLELISFPVAIAAGQLLFKRAAGQTAGVTGVSWLIEIARLPTLWLALALYGGATLLWVRVLTTMPLSRAYPFMALAFVLVPAASHVFFQEPINTYHVVGTVLIVIGVLVVARA